MSENTMCNSSLYWKERTFLPCNEVHGYNWVMHNSKMKVEYPQ